MQFWKTCAIVNMVLPINGKRAAPHRVFAEGHSFFCPPTHRKGGQRLMITYSELFQFCILMVSVISLVIKVCNSKKK